MAKLKTKWFLICSVLLAWETSLRAEPRLPPSEERTFYQSYVRPTVERFVQIPQLGFSNQVEKISTARWELDYIWNTNEVVLARIYLTNRVTLTVQIKGTNCAVSYYNNAKVNPLGVAGDESPERAIHYGKLKNTLDDQSALKLARDFFIAAGHQPRHFNFPNIWRLGWGNPDDKKNYIPLPFYEFTWLRKDVGVIEPGQVFYPRVRVVVSGLTQEVLTYSRFSLPILGDFDPTAPVSSEDKFIKEVAFPAVQAFCRLPHLPFGHEIQTNNLVKWSCDYDWKTGKRTAAIITLADKKILRFLVTETNCQLSSFKDHLANPLPIVEQEEPTKAKLYAGLPNQFTNETALAFAESFAKAVGADLRDFRLVTSRQIARGQPEDKLNYFPVPFYEFLWMEKSSIEPKAGVSYPTIHIIVSGLTKKVVAYDRLSLPVVTDEQFLQRYSTNTSELYQPSQKLNK